MEWWVFVNQAIVLCVIWAAAGMADVWRRFQEGQLKSQPVLPIDELVIIPAKRVVWFHAVFWPLSLIPHRLNYIPYDRIVLAFITFQVF